ncbi:WGR domain-containing protein (plasmid) [Bosea sp. F3-2]|uniref:WGR domain-containing protein n=1 Tax=Bosea sp. F3-2 TaxID=2599640 RepID=UPI0011ECEB02|nr:WGR domain-containing protein [Bosea sp. F3-2]QEL26977.1 WGR domain-containing protein [Bosea sp. F3-2]
MLHLVVLDRIEPSQNMQRYYVLSIEPTLWGEMSLVRQWGRIGHQGGSRIDIHPDEAAAKVALDAWLHRKRRRGYRERLA